MTPRDASALAEEHFRACLRAQGLRCTPDRLNLFRVLMGAGRPLSRLTLVEALRAHGIHATTVYRAVEQFSALGWIRPVLLGNGIAGYELQPPFVRHHHHFICTRCGTIADLPAGGVDAVLEAMAGEMPGVPEEHRVDVYGTCHRCLDPPAP